MSGESGELLSTSELQQFLVEGLAVSADRQIWAASGWKLEQNKPPRLTIP
jgi:hypothetical protein